ncbi:MAG: DUF2332 domain-containing protein [Polyangiales bacterium]
MLDARRDLFRAFVRDHGVQSPLYGAIAARVAEDEPTLELLSAAKPGQARPVLLFAAVHELLLAGIAHPLARSYPSVGGAVDLDAAPALFLDFCRVHREAVRERIATRTVQTNEVARAAYLYAGLLETVGEGPIHLVEIGPSAGLLLLLDRYGYDFGEGIVGERTSGLVLRPTLLADARPSTGRTLPKIASRVGLDLEPVDVRDEGATRWLRACLFADELERLARFDAAVAIARANEPLRFVVGDACETLPGVIEALPEGGELVLMHTWALTYLDRPMRARFLATLEAMAAVRPFTLLGAEPPGVARALGFEGELDAGSAYLTRLRFGAAGRDATLLARVHPHGATIAWLA